MVHARHPFGPADFVSTVEVLTEQVESLDKYPFSIPAVAALKTKLDLSGGATFFVGENGSGKSTIVEVIAVSLGFNAEGGSQNFNFATRSSESALHRALYIQKGMRRPATGYFLRAESFFNVATKPIRCSSRARSSKIPKRSWRCSCRTQRTRRAETRARARLMARSFDGVHGCNPGIPGGKLSPPMKCRITWSTRSSTFSCVSPAAFNCVFVTCSE